MNRQNYLRGVRIAIPVMLGYLPVGFAFGILAVQAGLSPFLVGLMAYFVYAGSAQLIVLGMLAAGASISSIIMTTFVVNLRHLLMSAAVTPYLRGWSKPLQAWFSFEMTDETFALNMSRFLSTGVSTGEVMGINITAHFVWAGGCVAGALVGDVLGDIKPYGLDFALIGMFIALILPHIVVPRKLLAVIAGASLSVTLSLAGVGQWSVIIAAALAATIATIAPVKDKVTA